MNASWTHEPDQAEIMLIDAQHAPNEAKRLKNAFPRWTWREMDSERFPHEAETAPSPDAFVVLTNKGTEKQAIEICDRVRASHQQVPVLVGITIYQMMLGNEVKKRKRCNFIFTPIEKDDVVRKLEELDQE